MTQIDEQTERLINRYLDGEASPEEAERAALLIETDPGVRELASDYRSIDGDARAALCGALVRPMDNRPMVAAVATRPRRGTWLATAAGVMAAAATLGLFVFPAGQMEQLAEPAARGPSLAQRPRTIPQTTFVADEGFSRPEAWQRVAPHRDVVDIQQKWVVVMDPKTQQVYMVNMDKYDAASVPVMYEH